MMISNFRYYSFKSIDDGRRVPFVSLFLTTLVCLAVLLDPPKVLFALALTYALSGPVAWLIGLFRKKNEASEAGSCDDSVASKEPDQKV